MHSARQYYGVTISSTFKDLQQHRDALIDAIHAHDMKAVAMENDSAKLTDIINSSLKMVQDGAVYACIIGMKYGQIPPDPKRNPENRSITELEFNEALRLNKQILLFIMGEDHPLTKKDFETDAEKIRKLDEFRERAKEMGPDQKLHRVYATFNNLEEFKEKIGISIADARRFIESSTPREEKKQPRRTNRNNGGRNPIPNPPTMYAEPPYIGSHKFVGRQAQINELNDWAHPADTNTILLYDAIGGSGKSILTWDWAKNRAPGVREWAGIFWYSFYEKGAVMAGFCRHALAYITCQPLETFKKQKTREMAEQLLHLLQEKPFLIVLDGLERLLVSYHRIDAAEIPDEELDNPTDKITRRDPIACINDADDDLLRLLATAAPSKILVSTRLMPRVLMNPGNQPIPGVVRITLSGLRPADAELLFRACGVMGDAESMQQYLRANCACHPLTIGILAGIINNDLHARGNFDTWLADPYGAKKLNLAELDIVQRRNHILKAALKTLPTAGRQLLSTLALLSDSVDYETLSALNPHENLDTKELERTVKDLEMRGLLQYDNITRQYDLHPVVRGIAVGGLGNNEKEQYGKKVVDFFNTQTHSPYEEAETMDDVRVGTATVRTLLKMGHYQHAFDIFEGELSIALLFNLEAYKDVLALIKPFFPNGWGVLPTELNSFDRVLLSKDAAIALGYVGEYVEALTAYSVGCAYHINTTNLFAVSTYLYSIAWTLREQGKMDTYFRMCELDIKVAEYCGDKNTLFLARLNMMRALSLLGNYEEAESMWQLLHPMGRSWNRIVYRPGTAELYYALLQYQQNKLEESQLAEAQSLAKNGKTKLLIRKLHWLRGKWHIGRQEWQAALYNFTEAVRMAREAEVGDISCETGLCLAKYHLGQINVAIATEEAEKLSQVKEPDYYALAELWLALKNIPHAKKQALAAYKNAWADGEPYVRRDELNKAIELLQKLGEPIPQLPPYDPAKDIKFSWEPQLQKLLEELKKKKRNNK